MREIPIANLMITITWITSSFIGGVVRGGHDGEISFEGVHS